MLTQEEDVEIHALKKRGWSVSEIARHTGRDRKTIRAYLSGKREPGVRAAVEADPFDLIEAYVAQRLVDDHGVWATTLFDEVQALGYDRSYPTFTRKLRQVDSCVRIVKPAAGSRAAPRSIIDHLAGEEIQWDWDELGACPWDETSDVSMLVGVVVAFVQEPGVARLLAGSGASGGGYRSGAAPVRWHRTGCGGWIGWRRWSTRPPARSRRRSRRWRNTTG